MKNVLVWDEIRGTVVCSECGTVVDSIYVTSAGFNHGSELLRDRAPAVSGSLGKLTNASVKYLAILKEIKHKPLLYIDPGSFDRYLVLGKRVKVIRRKLSLPKNDVLDRVVKLTSKYPKLCSRTDRAKYAIAVIAYTLVTAGSVDILKLSKDLGLSKTHIRRLLKVVKNSRDFLDEVRKSLPIYCLVKYYEPVPRD